MKKQIGVVFAGIMFASNLYAACSEETQDTIKRMTEAGMYEQAQMLKNTVCKGDAPSKKSNFVHKGATNLIGVWKDGSGSNFLHFKSGGTGYGVEGHCSVNFTWSADKQSIHMKYAKKTECVAYDSEMGRQHKSYGSPKDETWTYTMNDSFMITIKSRNKKTGMVYRRVENSSGKEACREKADSKYNECKNSDAQCALKAQLLFRGCMG